jgi:hypothetical protein
MLPYNLSISDLAAFISASVALLLAFSTRRKAMAEASESISNAAKTIVDTNSEEMKRLSATNHQYQIYIEYLLQGISRLRGQLLRHHLSPVFTPKSFTEYKEKHPL